MSSQRAKYCCGAILGAAAPLLAAGILFLTSPSHRVIAAQTPGAPQAMRLPDATEFPSWERPSTFSKTYYVDGRSTSADDAGPGTKERPFRTIGKAADVLQPGERVVIAEGIYREVVQPKNGGAGADRMIGYEAADGANVIVRGSMVVADGWRSTAAGPGRGGGGGQGQNQARTWEVDLDGRWFGGYNPFGMMNMPQQRWQYMNRMSINVHNILVPYTRVRGIMFVDGKPLDQVRVTSELFGRDPSWAIGGRSQPYSAELFRELGGGQGKYLVDQSGLSLRVRMPNDDGPDGHLIEVTTKAQVFAPARGLGYIRVKGITFEHAGNNFPFPQTGMVSTNGGHHWIIEGNTFQWANSICLSVGGGGGPAAGGGTTSHIIRGNTMRYCGLSGLTGMGTSNLLVEDNLFEWIGWQNAEHMSESAGIKFHNARNLLLRNNVIRHMRNASGIWLDVGNINCRLTRNVFTDILTAHAAIWVEASHEQNQVDTNLIIGVREADKLTPPEVETGGGSGFYVLGTDRLIIANNLIANAKRAGVHFRTEEIRIISGRGGTARGNKVYNNLLFNTGESAINFENEHNEADGNLYAALPGGFLRVLRPGRPELLNIPAAREYYGWEKNGQMGSMRLSFDPDSLQLELSMSSDVAKVKSFNGASITSDFFGVAAGEARVPGPFADLSALVKTRSIDPRSTR
jgi:Right handed beta helix region